MSADPARDRLRDAYERTHARLWRAVLGWSGSAEVADEACAEAFAQAARRGDAVRDVDAWVWRAAFRLAAGELDHRRRRPVPLGVAADVGREGPAGGAGEPGGDVDDADLAGIGLPAAGSALLGALRQLSDQQRACLLLREVAGLTGPEAADALGTTTATVRVQAMRGRRRLRQIMEGDGDG